MIIVYPMLISGSVSPNALPGIIKAVEKYILLYNTDDVLKAAGSSIKAVITAGAIEVGKQAAVAGVKSVGKAAAAAALRVKKGKFFIDEGYQQEQSKIKQAADDAKLDAAVAAEKALNDMGQEDKKKKETVGKLELPRYDAISLEPTWLQVTTQRKGLQILGVKVVPFRVDSATNLVQMFMDDRNLKTMDYLQRKYGRTVIRIVFRALRGLRIPVIKDKALTGNPKWDVIWAGTQYGKNMFICFSQLDIEESEAFSNPRSVQKIHKLGWASFIMTDDVNKQVTFCMKQFGGICSSVPYGFLYASVGKEHLKVYDDLEDVKRSSGPFFRMKTTRKKIFSDSLALSKLNKYLIKG